MHNLIIYFTLELRRSDFSFIFPLLESPSNITLSIVRDQGASGNVVVHYTTRPVLSLPLVSQASEGQDYIAKQASIIMMENATVALVTITILPVISSVLFPCNQTKCFTMYYLLRLPQSRTLILGLFIWDLRFTHTVRICISHILYSL